MTNEERIKLFAKFGVAIGPIVEAETLKNMDNAHDCVWCLLAHITEIAAITYNWDEEEAKEYFNTSKNTLLTYAKELRDASSRQEEEREDTNR